MDGYLARPSGGRGLAGGAPCCRRLDRHRAAGLGAPSLDDLARDGTAGRGTTRANSSPRRPGAGPARDPGPPEGLASGLPAADDALAGRLVLYRRQHLRRHAAKSNGVLAASAKPLRQRALGRLQRAVVVRLRQQRPPSCPIGHPPVRRLDRTVAACAAVPGVSGGRGLFRGPSRIRWAQPRSGRRNSTSAWGAWISAWVRHLQTKGLPPERLGLLIHDEPHEGSDTGPLVAWATSDSRCRAEGPDLGGPHLSGSRQGSRGAVRGLRQSCAPTVRCGWSGARHSRTSIAPSRAAGRTLQFYSCSGPAKLLDPYSYHRLQGLAGLASRRHRLVLLGLRRQ